MSRWTLLPLLGGLVCGGCLSSDVDVAPTDAGILADAGVSPDAGSGGADGGAELSGGFTEAPSGDSPWALPSRPPWCDTYSRWSGRRQGLRRVAVGPRDDWQAAIAEAEAGDEIVLAPGRYVVEAGPLQIPGEVILRGLTGDPRSVQLEGGLRLAGPDIHIGDVSAVGGAVQWAFAAEASGAALYNVRSVGATEAHLKARGGAEGAQIVCVEITAALGGPSPSSAALDLADVTGWQIDGALIYALDGVGIRLHGNSGADNTLSRSLLLEIARPVVVEGGHGDVEIRNVFAARRASGGPAFALNGAGEAALRHVTARVAGSAPISAGPSLTGLRLVNALLSAPPATAPGLTVVDEGSLYDATDADFESPADYHLDPESAAVGAGAPSSVTVDLEGEPRSAPVDVGCDQVP